MREERTLPPSRWVNHSSIFCLTHSSFVARSRGTDLVWLPLFDRSHFTALPRTRRRDEAEVRVRNEPAAKLSEQGTLQGLHPRGREEGVGVGGRVRPLPQGNGPLLLPGKPAAAR